MSEVNEKSLVLLTGASGVMGRVLCQRILEMDFRLRLLLLPQDPNLDLVKKLIGNHKDVELVLADITQVESLKGIMNQVDIVYHLAGLILSADYSKFEKVNTKGTINLIKELELEEKTLADQGLKKAKTKFIYISSASVTYPKLTDYGKSKVAAEKSLQNSNVDWTIIRPTLVCDQGGSIEFNLFLDMLKKMPIIVLPGGGRALKQPIHTNDLVEGLLSFLKVDSEIISKKIYNFSGGKSLNMREMTDLCLKKMNLKKKVINIPAGVALFLADLMEFVVSKPASPKQAIAGFLENADLDNSLTVKDLYFKPRAFSEFIEEIFPREN